MPIITLNDYFKKDIPFYKKIIISLIKKLDNYNHYKSAPNPTLKELYQLFISTHPQKEYYLKWSYQVISNNLKNKHFKDISLLEWQHEIDKLIEKKQSLSTQKRMRSLVKQLSEFAAKLDIDIVFFFDKLLVSKPSISKAKIPFTRWEIQQLWKSIDKNPDIKDILILIYTGLRVSEYLNLKIEDIHFKKRYLVVTKSKTKAGTNRYVPLHRDIIPLLKEKIKLAKYKPTTYIARNYASEEKYNYSKFSTAFKNCFKNLGFKHSIHECRHTFITLLDSNNVPLIVIKKIVGHVPDDLTGKVYTHVSFIDIIKAIDKLKGKKIIYEHIKQSKFI